ncbi:MAG: UDP-N-acetylmuramoyl-L-alanine--D-glutamate ligase [Parcubacteria group bacterium]
MKIEDLKNKKVTVMGLGLHGGGIGTVRFLSGVGAKVIVTDLKSKEELAPSLEKLKDLKGVEYVLGQHRPEDFTNTDMVVKTPPVSWSNKYIKLALEKNVPVEVDSSLFFKLCKNPIIGITGTRGKTTTSTLIFEILKAAGKNPLKAGIGQIPVLSKIEKLRKDSIVVFELSSWRLAALGRYKLSPKVAVFTNVYCDHLNYYKTMDDYAADKKNIFLHQKPEDTCVINWDNEITKGMAGEVKSSLVKFSLKRIAESQAVFVENGAIYFNNGVDEKKVMEIADIKIRGAHNIPNILAAIGACEAMGVDFASIKKAIADFSGLSHRLEFVHEFQGVKYFNDTAATSPEGALAGINSFSEPIILISGGADKNLDVSELGKAIAQKVKAVVFLQGTATEKIINEIKKNLPAGEEKEFTIVDSMAKAVELAQGAAEAGDVVLLSPGVASFGLFANEFDRGDKFKEAVKSLK